MSERRHPVTTALEGAVVVVAGATSPAGIVTVSALREAGALAVAVGSDHGRLAASFGSAVPQRVCDLSDFAAVRKLATALRTEFGRIDGVLHLVGGWRGGGSLSEQSDEDWAFLLKRVVSTLRNTTRAFFDDVLDSPQGRFAMISSTAATRPTASGANYAAAKAAAETWMQATAQGLASLQSERKDDPSPQTSAAVVIAVKALVDDAMRAAQPERRFPGYTSVEDLASELVSLFTEDAAVLNGARLDLTTGDRRTV